MGAGAAALLALAGLIGGFLAGVFGIGDGIILVPVLLAYLHAQGVSSLVATHVAIGTSLLVVALASAAQAWEYRRTGQVIWRAVIPLAAAGAGGAIAGTFIAAGLEGPSLRKIFGFLLLVAAVRLFSGKRKQPKEPEPDLSIPPLAGTGFLLGLLSSLSGMGGALVAVPLLTWYRRFPLRKSFGTSGAAIAFIALAGAACSLLVGWGNVFLPPESTGFIDWRAALPLGAGAVCGIIAGTRWSLRADTGALRNSYAVILLVVMLRMFFL